MVSIRQLNLPSLASYSEEQLTFAKQHSPALARQLKSLEKSDLTQHARTRAEGWSQSALATIFKTATTREICEFWTYTADTLIRSTWNSLGLNSLKASCFALGKLGAQELNLSSDVDLVILADSKDLPKVVSALRHFRSLIENDSSNGSLLRIDFDLRPGGRFGPIVTTPGQLSDYYWSQGETWERLAWVRARPIVGEPNLCDELPTLITPFCFRKYLDFTVLDDLKILRSRIHLSQTVSDEAVHLKLGVGGIRDLELFVHALLIIHGGRRPELRTHSTSEAILNLKAAGLLPASEADFLLETYWALRHVEHCVQAVEDQQTHWLKHNSTIAFLPEPVKVDAINRMKSVDKIVSSLLGEIQPFKTYWPPTHSDQIKWLQSKGIEAPIAENVWPQLLGAVARSGKTERDELSRQEFLGRFFEELERHGRDLNLGLTALLDFVKSSRAKATLFSLLLREPRLIRDLASLFSTSPYLSQVLCSRPELLDSFLSRQVPSELPDWEIYLENLVERRLLTEITSSSEFITHRSLTRLGVALSDCADQISSEVLARLLADFNSEPLSLLSMGKWGGRELGLRSDLDFVVICDGVVNELQQRIVRRFVSRLTESHRGGRLYSVDLRLRPSGHSGPLLLNREALLRHLKSEAEVWRRQAFLRARSSDSTLHNSIRSACISRPLDRRDYEELKDIRKKMLKLSAAKAPPQTLDLKSASGGLIDIEFATQIAILKWQVPGTATSTLGLLEELSHENSNWAKAQKAIERDYTFLRTVEQLLQLTSHQSGSIISVESPEFIRLARTMGQRPDDLFEQLTNRLSHSSHLIQSLDPLQDEN